MSGMNSKNCCKGCSGDTPICCLKGTFVGGAFDGQELFFVKRSYGSGAGSTPSVWEFGEACSETDGSGKCNNMNGYLRTGWNTSTDLEETDPFRAFRGCMPDIHLKWMPDTAECKVKMFLGGSAGNGRLFIAQGSNCGAYHPAEWPYDQYLGHIWTLGYSAYNLNSNWHTGTVTLTDWRYMILHDANPTEYPLPAPTLTIEACPVRDSFEPVDNGSIRYFYKWQYRILNPTTGVPEGDWLDTAYCGVNAGDCMCISSATATKPGFETYYGFNWPDKVGMTSSLFSCPLCLPADLSCNWYDDLPDFIECPNNTIYYDVVGEPFHRIAFTKLSEGEAPPDCGAEGGEPTGEEDYCFKASLCVQMAFDKETEPSTTYASSVQCYMPWDSPTERYFLEDCGSSEKDCEATISMVEVIPVDTCPADAGYREWEVTILITAISTGLTLYEDTFRACLKCRGHWSIMQYIVLETTTIDLRIGTTCSTVPTPPECDPGCWPECIGCPEQATLILVLEDNPLCCLPNSMSLTYNSGTNNYSSTAGIGGPLYTCGQVTACRVGCHSSTSLSVSIDIMEVDGSSQTLNLILNGSCSGGHFETESYTLNDFHFFGFSFCGTSGSTGVKFRVISI